MAFGNALLKHMKTKSTLKHADDNIEAGREFVESYVIFTHYVEGLH